MSEDVGDKRQDIEMVRFTVYDEAYKRTGLNVEFMKAKRIQNVCRFGMVRLRWWSK